jgi:hypothetical protein
MRKTLLAAGAAFAVISTAAMASVSFDSNTGTGFVGKGDVQVLYGWNNAAFNTRASGLTFAVVNESSYDAVCMWVTGPVQNRRTHRVTHKVKTGVNASVAYDIRKNSQGQATGINLTGFGSSVGGGDDVPVVGGSCQGEGAGGTWESVDLVSQSGGGLQVTYGGVTYPLPNTPVI